MAHYLVYWKPSTVAADEQSATIEHSASEQYGRVGAGDMLWIVTSEGPNDLMLVGRQRVDRIVGQAAAERELRNRNIWEAGYHVICDVPEDKSNLDISRWAHNLTFVGVVEQLPVGFTGRNLQQMRHLDEESADLLEQVWARRENAVPSTH